MELVDLSREDFDNFAYNHELYSWSQSSALGDMHVLLKDKNPYYVGFVKDGVIVGASLFLKSDMLFNKCYLYAPRGFLIDYNDSDLVREVTGLVKRWARGLNAIYIRIDPNFIYAKYDSNFNCISSKNDSVIDNLKALGYKHFGFNKRFETTQVRWMYRIRIAKTFDETINIFSKSTRKNTLDAIKSGVMTRIGGKEDLKLAVSLLQESANEKHFFTYNLDHFEKMYEAMEKFMTFYIAYIDGDRYINTISEELKKMDSDKKNIEEEFTRVNSKKISDKLEVVRKRIEEYNNKIKIVKKLVERQGNIINIGALLSIKNKDEYVTFLSGMKSEYRLFNPKYVLYTRHIIDACNLGYKYVNFYGIAGVNDKSDPLYKIFEIKKGYNGEIVELIGQFDLVINKNWKLYKMINRFLKVGK